MSNYIEVVRPSPFCPNTDMFDWARGRDSLFSAKDFALNILERDFGIVYPHDLKYVAERISVTYPATSEMLRKIAFHGGMLQVS